MDINHEKLHLSTNYLNVIKHLSVYLMILNKLINKKELIVL